MPKNSPIYGLPYLVGSDGGRNIKEVSEALALKLDAVLAQTGNPPLDSDLVSLLQRLAGGESEIDAMPYAQAAGKVASPGGGSSSGNIYWDASVVVTLPAGRFSRPPIITAAVDIGSTGGVSAGCSISNVTTTSFTIRMNRVGSAPTGFTAHWHAVQMKSGSAEG